MDAIVTLGFASRSDTHFQMRIRRSTLVAFLASILLHALLLLTAPPLLLNGEQDPLSIPITVQLNAPARQEPAAPPVVTPPPKPAHSSRPKVIASPRSPTSIPVPSESKPVPAEPPAPLPPVPAPITAPDLMSYMQAARERRRLAELGTAREPALPSPPERVPSADEARMANIKRNLQSQGTNGLFQILSMGVDSASFSFRGWTNDYSTSRREVIEVDVAPGEDLQRAVVRRMIEIIRRHYTGDFNWESIRLGRVVVMSARVQDSAGLEDFMMLQFFGPGLRYPSQ